MAENAMTRLKKSDFMLFLDTAKSATAHTWKRSIYSTIFDLDPAPQTETFDYIAFENAIEETTGYKPVLPQEAVTNEGDPIYDFIFGLFYDLPIGSALTVPALVCFGGSENKAWEAVDATVTLGSLNTVEGKINYTVNLGGNITRGTYTIMDGAPTFTAANA